MNIFVCPVCRRELEDCGSLYKCGGGHCFDKSKFGYVNLLQSQKSSSKRHGDDRLMVRARRDFLDSGGYSFLLDALCKISLRLISGGAVLDAGCGECYYSSGIKKKLLESGINAEFFGVDISKDALEFASKRKSGIKTAVASLFDLPVADESCSAVLNVFSPQADSEFRRVLKKDGILIRVIPLEKHLFELKSVIYDKPYENEVPGAEAEGFSLIEEKHLRRKLILDSSEETENLFKMTPYYYKTGREDQLKISGLNRLETRAEFGIRVYRKEG
ncbi:MAG: putative RNA methyltransferase [Acutalibacteraceae bacterium]